MAEMEPGLQLSDFGRVMSWVSVSDPMFDPVLSFNMRIYRGVVRYRVTPSRQTNIRGFGFRFPSTGLLISVSAHFIYILACSLIVLVMSRHFSI